MVEAGPAHQVQIIALVLATDRTRLIDRPIWQNYRDKGSSPFPASESPTLCNTPMAG